ncbi:MAG: aminotransferase class I/II-fold pyridoxal phosphate-dependent enzyme [Planctomycetes bacterium]|nr:aminotransferase class I/II-fold pyridoxal phosphate-dependent enzyme [Planctomycetota bacterium]
MAETSAVDLSSRMKQLPPYLFGRLNRVKYELRQKGADIIDLGMGNPNDPPPQLVIDKLCEAVRNPKNHRYSTAAGVLNLRREVAKHYAHEYGVNLDPEKEIISLIGSKEGISHLCLALLGPGDTAVVPSPAFPIHIYGPALAGANALSIPIGTDETFVARLKDVVENLWPQPKVLILNFPHNPTAATAELEFYEEVVAFARTKKLIILHDFAYCDTVFDGYRAPSIFQVKGARDIAVEFTTMSKPYNMAGWRIGFCVGNEHIVHALERVKGYYDYGLFQAVQIAAIVAIRHCRKDSAQQALVYQQRRDVLCDGLNRNGWSVPKPKGTMFVWAPIPEPFRAMGSMDFALMLMEEAEVAVAPGIGFGPNGEGFLRLALVENELRLKQAVRQITRALRAKSAQTAHARSHA